MLTTTALDALAARVAMTCRAGLPLDALRAAVLPQLRKALPVDALWWAVADPATLLFTSAFREELPADTGPYFVENEFIRHDVNKWTELARDPIGVRSLMEATQGRPASSERYRDIFEPLGLQDELRAVLRIRGTCWGFVCLHREAAESTFSAAEAAFVRRLAPHLAEGIRMGLLHHATHDATHDRIAHEDVADGPGLVLIGPDGTVTGLNATAGRWLVELGGTADGSDLPVEMSGLSVRLRNLDPAHPALPRTRVRTRSGRWAVLHASWMDSPVGRATAVIVEEAAASDVAPLIMVAYGLTERERTITGLVCQGLSTRRIAERLHLTTDTVQDHLKSVFGRTGVHSRGELVAAVLQRDYLPRAGAGDQPGRTGAFPPAEPVPS